LKILALIVSLSLLIFTHELGHYFFARLFKVRVNRFYLFFNWGFSILKAKKFDGKWHFLFFNATTPDEWKEKEPDNTLWGIGWIPLGGYCDIAGMVDETKDADDLEKEPQPWEYRTKKPWQRLCIISGGVLVNFLSALLIYTGIFAHWGKDDLPMRNAQLGYDYHQILLDDGFRNGDIIYAIDGVEMTDIAKTQDSLLLTNPKVITVLRSETLVDTLLAVQTGDTTALPTLQERDTSYLLDLPMGGSIVERMNNEKPAALMSIRVPFVVKDFIAGSNAREAGMQIGDSIVSVNGKKAICYSEITPLLKKYGGDSVTLGFYRGGVLDSATVKVTDDGKIGVQLMDVNSLFETVHTEYTLFQAIPAGISYGFEQLFTYARSLKILFTKGGTKQLGGFGTLGSLFPNEWNWYQFWWITALLAVILAFMNFIPIPGLDGGHILFTLWEMITRRKPSEKFLEVANTIGTFLLIALIVLANFNDIWRVFK